jgi:hypothetical protein
MDGYHYDNRVLIDRGLRARKKGLALQSKACEPEPLWTTAARVDSCGRDSRALKACYDPLPPFKLGPVTGREAQKADCG